nr:cytidine deaminase [Halobellus rufus]
MIRRPSPGRPASVPEFIAAIRRRAALALSLLTGAHIREFVPRRQRTNPRRPNPQPMTDELLERAREALDDAYVPYSEYRVGAALRTADGSVYVGCNIENANYSNSLHAEEVAIASAVRDGHREFDRIAVSSGARDGVTPCGMCRQTLAEFAGADLDVVCDEGDGETSTYTLGELLPNTISLETLSAAEAKREAAADDEGQRDA